MTPDFPTTAQLFQDLFNASYGDRFDGVISIDPVVRSYQVAALLRIAAGLKQSLLEATTAADRLERELEILRREISLLDMARSGRS